MKKSLAIILSVMVVFCFAVAVDVGAQGSITGNKVADTPHNLQKATGFMGVGDLGAICVYCHTPHNNNTAIDAPLWNRSTPTGPYTMYSSPTIDMDIATSPTGVSLACLSCHDNTIGLDQVINIPTAKFGFTPTGTKIENCSQSCHTDASPNGGISFTGGVIGTDLANDHPVSVTYDPSRDPKFHPASNGMIGPLPLYGANKDILECGSCHNPHDNSNRPFLRMSNQNSALCLTCHDI